jgi:protein translocase SecG subunit
VLSSGRADRIDRSSCFTVELILFLALVMTSFGLIAAVLMQSRGSGLGSTFGGGDSSVTRSRRGVEARLYQFTVVLTVLFVVVCMVVYIASI